MKILPRMSFLSLAALLPAQDSPRVLVVGGANNHDVRFTTPSLRDILLECGRFEVETTDDPATALADPSVVAGYDVFLLDYNGPRWGEPAESNFLDAVRKGAGVSVVHAANNAFPGWVEYETLVGLCWRKGTGHGRFHPFDVEVVDHYHPITRGMRRFHKHPDELYHRLAHMHGAELRVLMSAYSDPETGGSGRWEPMAIVSRFGEGRVFHTPLGHVWKDVPRSRASHADPQFRRLVQRGTEWAATGEVTLDPQPVGWLEPSERAEGFALLFDGRTTDGWRGYRQPDMPGLGWGVEDGALTWRSASGDIVTRDEYADFDLRFEWKVAPGANSGVIYRVTEDADDTWQSGPEYQVLDDEAHGVASDATHGAGALYGLAMSPGKVTRPAGAWNEGRVVVRGWHVEHWLNGKCVVEIDLGGELGRERIAGSKFRAMPGFAKAGRGRIALQDHGGRVWFRNVRIKEL